MLGSKKGYLRDRGSPGDCNPLQPARSPSILEGAGGSLARTGCAMERPGDFAASEDAILEAM